jgi:hypothetical protein
MSPPNILKFVLKYMYFFIVCLVKYTFIPPKLYFRPITKKSYTKIENNIRNKAATFTNKCCIWFETLKHSYQELNSPPPNASSYIIVLYLQQKERKVASCNFLDSTSH